MADAKLTIKVSSDVKGAAEQLKALGFSVENIQKKTEGVNTKAKAMDNILNKSAGSFASLASGLGTSMMGAAAAIAVTMKGVNAIVTEGLKVNQNAKTQVDKIKGVWTDIKADLGSALLDTISPALEALYTALVAIEKKVMQMTSGTKLNNALNSANRKTDFDFSDYSDYEIVNAYLARQKDTRNSWRTAYQWGMGQLETEINKRGIGAYLNEDSLEDLRTAFKNDRSGSVATVEENDPYSTFISRYGSKSDNYQKAQIESVINEAKTLIALYSEGQEEYTILNDIITSYTEELSKFNSAAEDTTAIVLGKESSVIDPFEELLSSRGNKSITYQRSLLEDEIKKINQLLVNPLYADDQETYDILVEMLRSCQEEYKNLEAVSEEVTDNIKDDISTLLSGVQNLFSSLNAFSSNYYQSEINRVEKSTESEEEKARKIDELKRKQFAADKANSIAALTISTAQGIMNATSTYASNLPMMSAMIGLISATSAVQLATILGQEYTGLATGGIVSQPTKALVGEGGEKEAIMPLSKLDEYVNREEKGNITIIVNVSGKGDTASDVYYAIERAQRTGLLPKWRYA